MARRVGPGWEVAHFGSCYKKAYNSYITSVRALRFVRSRGLRRGGVAAVCRARIIPGRTRPLAPATASDLPACPPPPLAHRPGPPCAHRAPHMPCSQESMPGGACPNASGQCSTPTCSATEASIWYGKKGNKYCKGCYDKKSKEGAAGKRPRVDAELLSPPSPPPQP